MKNLISLSLVSAACLLSACSTTDSMVNEGVSASNKDPQMSLVGRYTSGGTPKAPSPVAEIVSYHANSKSLFITVDTATEPSSFKRIDISVLGTTALSSPTTANNLLVSTRFNVSADVNDSKFTASGVQSLDVTGNLLAIAVQATPKTQAGVIAFYSLSATGTPSFLKKVTVGALPDGVAFSPNGKYLVVANEGELSNTFMKDGIDPEGSISIITINNGVPANTAIQLGFSDFNVGGKRASELPATVRIGRPGASVAQDLEPEYVAISADSKTAFVTLQENNAVAEVDLVNAKITKIIALGFKDYGSKYKIAASDRYAGTSAAEYNNPKTSAPFKNYANLYGVYLPDGIATYTVNGKTYFLTANEGDDRSDFLTGVSADTARFKDIVANLDSKAFPVDVVNTIKSDQELGRLTLLTKHAGGNYGDTDGDGDFDRVYVLGGRSFSIWDARTGAQVFDSGEEVERAAYKNATDDTENALALLKADQLLGRLDNKGPEPESIVVGQVGAETYAFVALERASAIMMYKITDPSKPRLVQYIRNTSNLLDGDISPEGLKFIPAAQSPTGVALLVVGYEVSGSVGVYQIK
jgi:DNA-binding beta-propeller fold protein YncE